RNRTGWSAPQRKSGGTHGSHSRRVPQAQPVSSITYPFSLCGVSRFSAPSPMISTSPRQVLRCCFDQCFHVRFLRVLYSTPAPPPQHQLSPPASQQTLPAAILHPLAFSLHPSPFPLHSSPFTLLHALP